MNKNGSFLLEAVIAIVIIGIFGSSLFISQQNIFRDILKCKNKFYELINTVKFEMDFNLEIINKKINKNENNKQNNQKTESENFKEKFLNPEMFFSGEIKKIPEKSKLNIFKNLKFFEIKIINQNLNLFKNITFYN